jgi:hypothetical protein
VPTDTPALAATSLTLTGTIVSSPLECSGWQPLHHRY